MKFIWLLFSFTVVGLSIYPEPVAVGDVTLFFHSFWLSESLFVRANQVVLLFVIFGFIRQFKRHQGKNLSRLGTRFLLAFASIATLYLPWDYLSVWDNIWVKILLTIVGAVTWFFSLAFLIGDPTPEEIEKYKAQRTEASERMRREAKVTGTEMRSRGASARAEADSQWLPGGSASGKRSPNIPSAKPGEQLTSQLKPSKSRDEFKPRDNQSVLSMGIRDLAGIKSCSQCGTDSTPYGKFCKECGTKF
jgi:hypothetical protein